MSRCFRVSLTEAEELFEREVRIRYIEILTFWRDPENTTVIRYGNCGI